MSMLLLNYCKIYLKVGGKTLSQRFSWGVTIVIDELQLNASLMKLREWEPETARLMKRNRLREERTKTR